MDGTERTSAARAAVAAHRLRLEAALLKRIEREAKRQLAAEIAAYHDRIRLGLIPRPYKPGPLKW
jgi:hypothetical protein